MDLGNQETYLDLVFNAVQARLIVGLLAHGVEAVPDQAMFTVHLRCCSAIMEILKDERMADQERRAAMLSDRSAQSALSALVDREILAAIADLSTVISDRRESWKRVVGSTIYPVIFEDLFPEEEPETPLNSMIHFHGVKRKNIDLMEVDHVVIEVAQSEDEGNLISIDHEMIAIGTHGGNLQLHADGNLIYDAVGLGMRHCASGCAHYRGQHVVLNVGECQHDHFSGRGWHGASDEIMTTIETGETQMEITETATIVNHGNWVVIFEKGQKPEVKFVSDQPRTNRFDH